MDAPSVEVFFDGDCPLCMREIRMLRRMDKASRIRFTDIAASDFDAATYGRDAALFMSTIQGRLPDGTWIEGVEVFRQLYSAVGLGPLVSLSRVPGVRQVADLAYRTFARNRLRLTGRCDKDGACKVPSRA